MHLPSPLFKIEEELLIKKKISLYLKRDDLIHPILNGNKYRKLKYNIRKYQEGSYSHMITFGGAFSNHIYATASIGQVLDILTVGIIRGEYDSDNPSLQHAIKCGMQLHFVDRENYRHKEKSEVVQAILDMYERPYLVPEGGTNALALLGTTEVMNEIYDQLPEVDYICVSAGTGGTSSGMLIGKNESSQLLVFSALKGSFLKEEISKLSKRTDFKLVTDYHFGGFAKWNPVLIKFINEFYQRHNLLLDVVYNGKGMYGLYEMISNNLIPHRSTIVWVVTGGQQGNIAWNYMNSNKAKRLKIAMLQQ